MNKKIKWVLGKVSLKQITVFKIRKKNTLIKGRELEYYKYVKILLNDSEKNVTYYKNLEEIN